MDGPPAEPAEPCLVTPPGTWTPRKGYSFYGSADYLFWYLKHQTLPTTISLSLSDPNDVPKLPYQRDSGGRFFVGTWLNDRQDWAFEGGYFFLGTRDKDISQTALVLAALQQADFRRHQLGNDLLDGLSTTFMGAEAKPAVSSVTQGFFRADCPANRQMRLPTIWTCW